MQSKYRCWPGFAEQKASSVSAIDWDNARHRRHKPGVCLAAGRWCTSPAAYRYHGCRCKSPYWAYKQHRRSPGNQSQIAVPAYRESRNLKAVPAPYRPKSPDPPPKAAHLPTPDGAPKTATNPAPAASSRPGHSLPEQAQNNKRQSHENGPAAARQTSAKRAAAAPPTSSTLYARGAPVIYRVAPQLAGGRKTRPADTRPAETARRRERA